jgi:hypothetical protein
MTRKRRPRLCAAATRMASGVAVGRELRCVAVEAVRAVHSYE